MQNSSSKQQLKDLWADTRRAGLTEASMTAYIDAQEEMLQASQRLNFLRWPIMNQYVHQNPTLWGSYTAEVENVRTFMTERIQWMDRKLGFDASTLETGIQTPSEDSSSQKILRNGQLLILRNGAVYTPSGTRIQ